MSDRTTPRCSQCNAELSISPLPVPDGVPGHSPIRRAAEMLRCAACGRLNLFTPATEPPLPADENPAFADPLSYLFAYTFPAELTGLGDSLRSTELTRVVQSFRASVMRLQVMYQLPGQLIFRTALHQRAYDEAEAEVCGALNRAPHPPDVLARIDARKSELIMEHLRRVDRRGEQALGDMMFTTGDLNASGLIRTDKTLRDGFEAILTALVIGVWSAFETLAGDLWEEALNAHPKRFAALCGVPSRIAAKIKRADRGSTADEPADQALDRPRRDKGAAGSDLTVSLGDIHMLSGGQCDLSRRMGSLIRHSKRVSFASIADIREAYSLAFDKRASSIDPPLMDPHLDALSLVRNVLVHRAGVADFTYVKNVKGKPAPQVEDKSPVPIDGKLVGRLIGVTLKRCVELVSAVDLAVSDSKERP